MEYVVFKTGGKQYLVKPGDILEVQKIESEKKDFVFEEVLLVVKGGKVTLGKPYIKGAKVSATILEQKKGKKIRVSKFKAKARYRRTLGFRPLLTKLQIEGYKIGDTKPEKEAKISKTKKAVN